MSSRLVLLAALAAPAAAHAKPSPAALDPAARDVGALVDQQLAPWKLDDSATDDGVYARDAVFAITGAAFGEDEPALLARDLEGEMVHADTVTAFEVRHRAITMAGDGRSAWASFDLHMAAELHMDGEVDRGDRDYRVTEIAVKTADGWQVAGGAWSTAQGNASVNQHAQAGKLRALAAIPAHSAGAADAALRAAFTATLTAPLDPVAAARTDLVTIGSGPGERTVGGAILARAWNAAWQGKLTVDGTPAAFVAPSGTTGWVIANVSLAKHAGKRDYKVPFRLLFVFDQDAQHAWHLVHAHLAVPAP